MIYLQFSESISPIEGSEPVEPSLLENAARATLQYAGTSLDVDLSIVLTDDVQLHEFNLQFLGVDAPTDVLAFPSGETDPDSGTQYLGDVIVSFPRAEAQAENAGHALERELRLLVTHGVLHLLGYDHGEEQQKAVMWSAQEDILSQLGHDL